MQHYSRTAISPHKSKSKSKGTLLTLLGVVLLSPDALVLSITTADVWTVIFWRGILFILGILLFLKLFYSRPALIIKPPKQPAIIVASIAFAVTLICFPFAIKYTSVANTLIIASCTPLFSALISFFFFKEKITRSTILVIFLCVVGVLIIMLNSLGSFAIKGDIAAVGYAVAMAIILSVLSHDHHSDSGEQVFITGSILAVLVTAPFIIYNGSFQFHSVLPYIPFGLLVLPVAMLCIKSGSIRIGAPEAGIILLSEAVFGPMWVYFVLHEVPSDITLITGLFIFSIILCNSIYQIIQTKRST